MSQYKMNIKIFNMIAVSWLISFLAQPALAAEPTATEMKEALLQTMQNQGGSRSGDDSVSVDNSISGASIYIKHFEKIGCEKASNRPGYYCDYEISAGMNFHSNEGTAAGDRHAAGINALFSALMPQNQVSTETRRFVRSSLGWKVLKN